MTQLNPVDLAWVFAIASLPMGAFGYGFSSISTPLLLALGYTNRQFTPILNFIELWQNPAILAISRTHVKRRVLHQALPLCLGIVPGTVLGSLILKQTNPDTLRLATLLVIAPLILTQAAGLRKPIKRWWILGPIAGLPVGILYGVTTISGPPLALILNNNGLAKDEFKAAISIVRTVESTSTFTSYIILGIFNPNIILTSALVAPIIVTSMVAGHYMAHMVPREDFRRLTMSFDAWVVGYGLSNAVTRTNLLVTPYNYIPLITIITIDSILLYKYFTTWRTQHITIQQED